MHRGVDSLAARPSLRAELWSRLIAAFVSHQNGRFERLVTVVVQRRGADGLEERTLPPVFLQP